MFGLKQSMIASAVLLLLLLLFVFHTESKLVDIDAEVFHIVNKHNEERRSSELPASNMREIKWDDRLAIQAAQWSERCRYERPPRSTTMNSNLYFESDHVHGHRTVHRLINTALRSWSMARSRFQYTRHCGRACSYVQMIHGDIDAVGCALSTCEDLRSGNVIAEYASLLVCFYSPSVNLLDSLPYTNGPSCSRCQRGMDCHGGLCAMPGTQPVPQRYYERASGRRRREPKPEGWMPQDKLDRNESYSLALAHNRIRDAQYGPGLTEPLQWDPYLERWANWVINCDADYPGPKHTYSNFERFEQGDRVYDILSVWAQEGGNTNIQMDHGCRTPEDKERCNHFTNVLQPELTSMACAARNCGDGTRQLVCVYDNQQDRDRRDRAATSELARLEYYRRRPTVDRRRRPTVPRRPRMRVQTRARTDPANVTARRWNREQRRRLEQEKRRRASRRYRESREDRMRRIERERAEEAARINAWRAFVAETDG